MFNCLAISFQSDILWVKYVHLQFFQKNFSKHAPNQCLDISYENKYLQSDHFDEPTQQRAS